MSFANRSLLDGESFPSLCSEVEQASMKVWAMTDKQESTVGLLLISRMKSGFLMKLTQKRNGKLLDFQEVTTSGSVIPRVLAASSKTSKSHLTAGGKPLLGFKIVLKKSSTNFWTVPLVDNNLVRNISGMALWVLSEFLWGESWSIGLTKWYKLRRPLVLLKSIVPLIGLPDPLLLNVLPGIKKRYAYQHHPKYWF